MSARDCLTSGHWSNTSASREGINEITRLHFGSCQSDSVDVNDLRYGQHVEP